MVKEKGSMVLNKIFLEQDFVINLETPTIDDRPVYISGSFNNWKARDEVFKMSKAGDGKYIFSFPKGAYFYLPFELKFLKGSWKDVELDDYGSKAFNHLVEKFDAPLNVKVNRWAHQGLSFSPDFYPIIETVSDTFEMPQLKKQRRVRILLPNNYYASDERYPVIYMQDAQNLFNDRSPYGNWAIDRRMAVLAEIGKGDVIIVAIDHGGKERFNEFSLLNSNQGPGEGKKFARFMADTLKPYIDKHYRTLPEAEHSGLGGSSMGGLISIYTGLMYPEVFSRKMIFSPSLWASRDISFSSMHFFNPDVARFYMYAGEKESDNMVPHINQFLKTLENLDDIEDNLKYKLHLNPEGTHSESHWSKVFPAAIDWLFFEK